MDKIAKLSQTSFPAFKNRIINGDFAVWQRGTSFTDETYYTADRFRMITRGITTGWNVLKSVEAENHNVLRLEITSANDLSALSDSFLSLVYRSEKRDVFLNKNNGVLSFYIKTNKAGKYTVTFNLYIEDTSLNDPRHTYAHEFEVTQPDTLQKITVNIPKDEILLNTALVDKDRAFVLAFVLDVSPDRVGTTSPDTWTDENTGESRNIVMVSNTNAFANTVGNYFEISKVQLEEGSVATDFEHVPYDIQLQRCMRYYEYSSRLFSFTRTGTGLAAESNGGVSYIVPKRVTPTLYYNVYDTDNPTKSILWNSRFGFFQPLTDDGYMYCNYYIADAEL